MTIKSQGFQITVKASRGRVLRLKVDAVTAEVVLFIPRGVSTALAQNFVDAKAQWIIQTRQRVLDQISLNSITDTAMLFGVRYPVVKSDRLCCVKDGKIYLSGRNIQESADKLYRKELQKYLVERIPYFEALTGLKSCGVKIRKMRTRWGSCNVSTKALTFNLMLSKFDKNVVDYVILHEIAHLKYANHGHDFKNYLSGFMPDWKKRKKYLKGV